MAKATATRVQEYVRPGTRARSEFKAERKAIQTILEELVPLMGMSHYQTFWELVDSINDSEYDDTFAGASVFTDDDNMNLAIKVNTRLLEGAATKSVYWADKLKGALFHELVHAVIDEHLLQDLHDLVDLLQDRDEIKGLFQQTMSKGHERTARILSRAFYPGGAP